MQKHFSMSFKQKFRHECLQLYLETNRTQLKYTKYLQNISDTYLEYGDNKGHGPASSQTNNTEEAVTKTLLIIQTVFSEIHICD